MLQLLQDTAFHVYDEDGDGKLSFDEWRSYAAESAEIKALLQMIQAEAVASSQSMWSGLSLKSFMAVAINERKNKKTAKKECVCERERERERDC